MFTSAQGWASSDEVGSWYSSASATNIVNPIVLDPSIPSSSVCYLLQNALFTKPASKHNGYFLIINTSNVCISLPPNGLRDFNDLGKYFCFYEQAIPNFELAGASIMLLYEIS